MPKIARSALPWGADRMGRCASSGLVTARLAACKAACASRRSNSSTVAYSGNAGSVKAEGGVWTSLPSASGSGPSAAKPASRQEALRRVMRTDFVCKAGSRIRQGSGARFIEVSYDVYAQDALRDRRGNGTFDVEGDPAPSHWRRQLAECRNRAQRPLEHE